MEEDCNLSFTVIQMHLVLDGHSMKQRKGQLQHLRHVVIATKNRTDEEDLPYIFLPSVPFQQEFS